MTRYPNIEPVKHRTWYYKFYKDDEPAKISFDGTWYLYFANGILNYADTMRGAKAHLISIGAYVYSQLDYVNEPIVKKIKPFK